MIKNILIALLIILNICFVAFYLVNNSSFRDNELSSNKMSDKGVKMEPLSMEEIKNYYSNKMSLSKDGIVVNISDFKNNVYSGSVSKNFKNCNPDDYCGGSAFYLSKKNGVILSVETNGEFDCKSLTDKGFDLETVDSMGMGCYMEN